jgi:tetratricopeptide (TPR) repeat protein
VREAARVKIGAYEVVSEIGRGGMGVVLRARTASGEFAVKVLTKTTADDLARFEREKRLLASFGEAEGFVPFLDAGTSSRGPYLVMPFLTGGTLRARLARGPLGIEETLALGRTLAQALGRAHARGIVHRDLKPENVLFDQNGKALLSDLGLAKHFRPDVTGASESRAVSRSGLLQGTPGYMPKEQMRDAKTVGPPADVFGLGAILYECLVGEPAFEGESAIELLGRVDRGTFKPIRAHRPEVPAEVASVLERALAPRPEARFQDGAAFGNALLALKTAKPVARSRRRFLLFLPALGVGLAAAYLGFVRPGEIRATVSAHVERAKAFAARGESALALTALDQALAVAPKDAMLFCLRGRFGGSRAPERAQKDLDRAIELAPDLAVAWRDRGAVRVLRGDLAGALKDLDRAIELDPKDAASFVGRAHALFLRGEDAHALKDLDRAIELEPGAAGPFVSRGGIEEHLGDDKAALADFTRAIELDPKEAAARRGRALALAHGHDVKAALEDANEALRLEPREAEGYRIRGNLLLVRGDNQNAIEDLTHAIELDPKNAESYEYRAEARTALHDREAALEDLKRVVELEPDSARGWICRGAAHRSEGDSVTAVSDYDRAIALDPGSARAFWGRAWARSERDRKAAIEDFTHAIELAPDDPRYLADRGNVYSRDRDYEHAIADFTHASELAPNEADYVMMRFQAHLDRGDTEAARADGTHFLELAPNDMKAGYVRDFLENGPRR